MHRDLIADAQAKNVTVSRRTTGLAIAMLVAVACAAQPAATSPAPSTPPASVAPTTAAPTAAEATSPPPPASPASSPVVTLAPGPTASATVAVTPASTPTSTLPPVADEPEWERVADQESLAGARMAAVVTGPDRYVAVGTIDDEEPSGIAWTSADGRIWVRAAAGLGDGDPVGVIWSGSTYVAFGGGESVAPAAVWTSPDGESWSRAVETPGFDDITFLYVAPLADRLFAIGGEWGDSATPRTDVFRTWMSTDGSIWQPVPADTPPPGLNALLGMTAANGMLFAWGLVVDGPSFRSVILRSTDGRAWQPVFTSGRNNMVLSIAGGHEHVVAVGSGRYCCEAGAVAPVRAWSSTDGVTWTRADFEPEPGSDQLERVVSHGGRYVALGSYAGSPIEWLSDDGQVWYAGDSVPDAAVDGDPCTGGPCPFTTVRGMAGGSHGLVAVGTRRIEDEDEPEVLEVRSVVWIAPATP